MLDASLEGRTECRTTKSLCGNANNFSYYHTYEKKKSCSINCIICSNSFQWVRSSKELAVTGWSVCPSCLWILVNLSALSLVSLVLTSRSFVRRRVACPSLYLQLLVPSYLGASKEKRSDAIAGEEMIKHSSSSPSNTHHLVFLKASLFLP